MTRNAPEEYFGGLHDTLVAFDFDLVALTRLEPELKMNTNVNGC
jgi:hypothetical protein